MKKTALSLLLALAMVFTMVLVAAPAAQAAGHTHCVCGDGKCTVGNHTHADVTWTEWTDATSMPTTTGNYYLSVDVTTPARCNIEEGAKINLCLNGHTAQCADNSLYKLLGASSLTITDCKGTGVMTGPNGTRSSGIIYADAGLTTLNLYAGTLKGCDIKTSGCVYWGSGTFNMYGGTMIGGKVTDRAGALNIAGHADKTIFNMYGGYIKGGESTSTENRGGAAIRIGGGMSGAITSQANIYGGVIEGGKANYGATIFIQQHYNELNIYGGVIKDGVASVAGNGIYAIGETTIKVENIDEGSFTIEKGPVSLTENVDQLDSVINVNSANVKATENGKVTTITKVVSTPSTPSKPNNPATGDSANLVVMGLGLVLGVAGMACLLPKKQKV